MWRGHGDTFEFDVGDAALRELFMAKVGRSPKLAAGRSLSLYIGIADGMSIARGWACRYPK